MTENMVVAIVVLIGVVLAGIYFLIAAFVYDPENVRNITNWFLSDKFSPDKPMDPLEEWTQTFNLLQAEYRKYISTEELDKASEVVNLIERHKLTMPPVPWYKFKRIK